MQKFSLGNTNKYNTNVKLSEVNEIREQIKALNVSLKDQILAFITALLISAITFSGPLTFIINMFIYYDLYYLLAFLAFVIIVSAVYLFNYLYLVGITKKEVKNLKKLCLNNLGIYGSILFFLFLLVCMGG